MDIRLILKTLFFIILGILFLMEVYFLFNPANICDELVKKEDIFYEKACTCLGIQQWGQCRGMCILCKYQEPFPEISRYKYMNITRYLNLT